MAQLYFDPEVAPIAHAMQLLAPAKHRSLQPEAAAVLNTGSKEVLPPQVIQARPQRVLEVAEVRHHATTDLGPRRVCTRSQYRERCSSTSVAGRVQTSVGLDPSRDEISRQLHGQIVCESCTPSHSFVPRCRKLCLQTATLSSFLYACCPASHAH